MKFSFSKSELSIKNNSGDKHSVLFRWPIKKVLEIDDVFIVMIEAPLRTIFNENVFGVSDRGKVAWQVAPIEYLYQESPYINIVEEDGMLVMVNWDGTAITADPKTGKELSRKWLK